MIINDLPTLKINKLTQKQFDNASMRGELEEQALYLTLDEGDNVISFLGFLKEDENKNLSAELQTSFFELNQTLEDKNIPRLMLVYGEDEAREIIEFKLFKYKYNLITFLSTSLEGIIVLNINNFDEITVSKNPYMNAKNDSVDSSSEQSELLITERAVWRSLNNFNSLYIIYCNIEKNNGIYSSITLETGYGKDLNTVLTEAAQAYQISRTIVLADPNKEIYLQGLMSVESDNNNSYKFIFNASETDLNIKNIIHLDASGFTCYNMKIQPELTIENTLNSSSNPITAGAVTTALGQVREELLGVAQGKCKTEIFNNKAELEQWIKNLSSSNIENMRKGDVFLLRSVGEPDYWWEPEVNGEVLTQYTTDDIVIAGKGAARILETTKVDINRIEENYAHKKNDLDNIKIKKALKYSTTNSSKPDGTIEYDTTNKKIYTWTNGSRGSQQEPQSNVLYLIIEE